MAACASVAKAGPAASTAERDARTTRRVQQIVDALRARLGLTAPVRVQLVDLDVRLASVRADGATAGHFLLALQRDFVTRLPEAQLEAALAHELGHVWISTHHPYLQTEQLANRIAMRVVPRARLVEVYEAVWGADALHGSFEKFLGVEATAATTAQQQ